MACRFASACCENSMVAGTLNIHNSFLPCGGRIALAARWIAAIYLVVASCTALHAEQLEHRKLQTERELADIRSEIAIGKKRRAELAREIDALEKDRAAINRNLIEASARQREMGKRIDRASARLATLSGDRESVRRSLRGRKALLAEVLAALQRMSSNPPPAILIEPADALSAVRSAILLGAVIPEIRAETEVLVAELSELIRIGDEIEAQRNTLSTDLKSLAEEEQRLNLLLGEKRSLTNTARQKMATQSAQAAELAAKATNLGKLIEALETEISASREAAEAARLAEEERRRNQALLPEPEAGKHAPGAFSDMARIAPAMEFSEAKGMLPMPAGGVVIREFGAPGRLGEPSTGISIATRIDERVTSPADGWVVYSGPFRSYGQLLILNAGSGYYVVMAGMDSIDVQLGQFVLAGEPVAKMGARKVASVESAGLESSRPVLYVEFRKDGQSIDPSPWWADATLKRTIDDS